MFGKEMFRGSIRGLLLHTIMLVAAVAFVAPPQALAVSGADVDFSGFVRLRHHTSNFATYNFGQSLPANKSVSGENDTRNFFEQRARLYIMPKVGENLVGNFAFEIDGRWGDSAFSTGGNSGFGYSADAVNLETKNLSFTLKFPGTDNSLITGLQTIKDPYNGIIFGWNDAGGLTYNHKSGDMGIVLGYYRFWQPGATFAKGSDVDFLRAEVSMPTSDTVKMGFNLHVILDNSGEEAGSTGVLGGDPFGTAGGNGYAPFAYNATTGRESLVGATNYTMNLFLPGVNFEADLGGVNVGGFFIYEFGRFDSKTAGVADEDIGSFGAELHATGEVAGFATRLSGMYVSGDTDKNNLATGIKKGGFYTTGSYSFAGAWMGLTGMQILFSDIDATHQDAALVYDATNIFEQQPLGILYVGLTGNKAIADKTRLELGLGFLASAEDRIVNGESQMATEINAGLHYDMLPGVTFGAVAAYAAIGDFYKVNAAQAADYNAAAPGEDVSAYDPDDMWKITLRTNYSF